MRKLLLSLVVVLFSFYAMAQQTQVIPLSADKTSLELRGVNPESFNAKLSFMEFEVENETLQEGDYSKITIKDGVKPNNIGQANLPVISKMIEVPYEANIQVVIHSYDEEVINLSDYGIDVIQPTQPSYTKSTPEEEMFFVKDEEYYATDEYETTPLIETEIHGIMRGMRIGRIEIRPYHYNPVENTLIVYNNLEFSINFTGANLSLTQEMKNKYYTNEFDGVYNNAINYIAPAAKDGFYDTSNPVKYVIVANTFFESTLQPFVEWKTRQGYNVIEYYVASGTTNTSIKTYLEGLYDGATASDPAPLYVLIVGDHSGNYSIPAFSGNTGSHVSDVYFATYDGGSDYLPDLYMGRLSCNTTTELQNALDKILPYEQYTMPSTSHLNNAVLIAGEDDYWGPRAGDAAIWYFAEYYINTAHGFSNIYAYYQNQTSGPYFAASSDADVNPSAATSIINNISDGIGFANYTAHCMEDGWADPNVYSDDIASFNNLNEYPFMIGNCCLSFKFNYDDSFGENLLQTANEGAVGYIGTSNNSLWDEDFWWGVGLSSVDHSNTANVGNFSPSNSDDGVYDALFHENGQSFSDWYYTASQIVYAGNTAVQSSSSGSKQYYWEIYHTSGDPSLMPYMSEPDPLTLSFSGPMVGDASLTVTTEAYTYVALSKDNVLLDAQWSGAGTTVTLTPPSNFTGETYCVVGTKQNRAPYINESIEPTAANPPVAEFSGTPTTILEGESVTFTDLSQYASTWDWTFGDGQTSTEQNPVHTYTNQGTYTVSLTVTNPLGTDSETKDAYITVNENTNPPTADFEADQTTINVGGTVNFTDLSIDNPTSWDWVFEGGTPATSTDQNPSVVYNTAGLYQVTLTAHNDHGDDDEIKLAYITVNVPDPCTASATSTGYEHISNFTFVDIDNDSGSDGYADYTSISTDALIGSTNAFSVTNGTPYTSDQCLIWVDWNRDGDFDDTNEDVYASANGNGPYTGDITVPATATAGPVILRIRIHDTGNGPNADPCGSSDYGEVEDYALNLISPTIPPTADFTSDATSSCTGIVQFTDLSALADSWSWNFGDGNTSTEQNPLHTYTADGTYTVTLYVENAYGNDTYFITDMITVAMPTAPSTTGDEACGTASLTLTATGSGDLAWYDAATGGDLVTTGASYTNTFTNTTTLYVQSDVDNTATFNVGPTDNSIGTGGYFGNVDYVHGLIFDAYTDFTLLSVWVDAESAKDRVINLKDASDNIIETRTVNIPAGESRVTLNMQVPAGTDYTLECDGDADLYRNQTGASYPYTEAGVLSIHYNTADDGAYYYFFYDWEVQTGEFCSSARVPVTATINEIPTVDLGDDVDHCGTSYTLDAGSGMSSYTWNGSPGIQTYNVTSTGLYTVVVENTSGCTATDNVNVTINPTPTVDNPADVTACDSYILPALTNGDYYETTGGVDPISAGTPINTTQTIYVWDANGTCEAENSFLVTINETPVVDAPTNVTECGSYILPALSSGDYYQNSGGVNPLPVGYEVTSDMTIYVYEETGTTPNCFDQNSFDVTILAAPVIDEPANVSSCETYTLPALSNGEYFLSSGGVSPISAGYEITATTTVFVWATNGTCDSEHSFIVTIDDMPTVDAPANVEECGEYVLPALTNGSYYSNTGGVGPISVGTPITTDQTIYVYASNGTCEAENSFTVTIFDAFTANATAIDESAVGANDGSVTVTMTGGTAPFEGAWTPAATTNTTGNSMTLSDLAGGYYSVVVTDDNGCTATAGATVNTTGAEPVAAFEADVTEGCGSLTVNFTDLSSNNPTTYIWNFGDGSPTSSDVNPVHEYTNPGVYTVTLFVENADGDDNTFMLDYIHVYENPTVTVDVTPASGELVADGSATANISGGTPDYTVTWSDMQEGITTSDLLPGNYSVIVEDENGCIATSAFVVNWVNFAGEEELVYSIYPNPASDVVNVHFDGQKCDVIQVWDMLGQIVTELTPQSDITTIDISNMQSGVYFIKVVFDNNEYTHKLVIK